MRVIILCVSLALVAGACGAEGSDMADTTTTSASSTAGTRNSTTTGTSTTTRPPETTTTETPPDPGVYRVAPAGPWAPPGLILFDAGSARKQGHTGEFSLVVNEPVHEIAEVPLLGFAFQSEPWSQRIWLEAGAGPVELLVAGEGQSLTLEGVVLGDDEVPKVIYQRHTTGDPEQTKSTLRSYNTQTGEVTELATTGGWESSTTFGTITGPEAVGTWTSEGYFGLTLLDLITGETLYDTIDDPRLGLCFDGDPECPDFRATTMWNGAILGVGPVVNTQIGYVDALGLYHFDEASGSRTLLTSWPWDNGLWYPEAVWAAGDLIVVSLRDGDFAPLPGLVVDMTNGESWTLPATGFVRPGWLS